jgi:phosphopantothenate---cysteine ligase (CTP)
LNSSGAFSVKSGIRLHILVTSGGTEVPIDAVRCITNFSRGTTGARIAEQALKLGHQVRYLCSTGTKAPFEDALTMHPERDLETELARLRAAAQRHAAVVDRLDVLRVKDFHAYHQRLLQLVQDPATDVAILCMAASDYGLAATPGKIPSNQERLSLELERLPKIISEIKKARPEIFLVGFKLLMDTPPDRLIDAAFRSMLRDGQDLSIANAAAGEINVENIMTYLVTKEKGIVPVPRVELPAILLRSIETRYSRSQYGTDLTRVEQLPLPEAEVNAFLADVHRLARLALFNPYFDGSREEFGFLAKRTARGTLITGRGSSKSQADVGDLSLVTALDESSRRLAVSALEREAPLNANIAHLVFRLRSEIQYILHVHIELPGVVRAARETAPGTQEDWESVEKLIRSGDQLIYQENHGIILLLHDLSELLRILEQNSFTRRRADLYNLAYGRFLTSDRFIDKFGDSLTTESRVVDLAAGTGEVSSQLLHRGFNDLVLADASTEILRVARGKLSSLPAANFISTKVELQSNREASDGIVLRQAVNYLTPVLLVQALSRWRNALKPGGKLLFSSFLCDPERTPIVRAFREEVGECVVVTQEGNDIDGNTVYHGHRAEIFHKAGGYNRVYDLSCFSIFSEVQLAQSCSEAGFSHVSTFQERNSIYVICER